MRRPLRRGIFIFTKFRNKSWLSFKYENLPVFCFACGRMGHGVTDCLDVSKEDKDKMEDDYPYSTALKAKSNL